MDKKIIIFAGPPDVGKDTAANATMNYIKTKAAKMWPEVRSLADPAKMAVHKMFGLFYDPGYYNKGDGIALKDQPMQLLFNKTPRQAYIEMIEMMQERYGQDILGWLATNSMHNSKNSIFIFSSGGANLIEWVPVINWVGAENILYVQLSAVGCSFDGDTRSYFGDRLKELYPALTVINIKNTISSDPFDKELFLIMVKGAVKNFLGIQEVE